MSEESAHRWRDRYTEVVNELDEARTEICRLRDALTVVACLPDRNGYTHRATLHDVLKLACYARGVLAGSEPFAVEDAVRAGDAD